MTAETTRLTVKSLKSQLPNLYPAIEAIGDIAESSDLERSLIELVHLRASQINGCAFCVNYHITNLLKLGVDQRKLNLVVAWRESGIFSERESAALAWAEPVTLVAIDHVPDAAFEAARSVFSESELIHLTVALCAINVWNRLYISFRFPPEFD